MAIQLNVDSYSFFIFDCDGVVLDSNQIKSQNFLRAIQEPDEKLQREFLEYHHQFGGVSRYVKFQYFFQELKKDPQWEMKSQAAIEHYGKLCRQDLLRCSLNRGAEQILQKLKARKKKVYLISGGDQEELRFIFQQRSLDRYFEDVLGSPVKKIEHLETLLKAGKIPGKGIFFGDGYSDMEAAQHCGLDFIYLQALSEWREGVAMARQSSYPIIQDFRDLEWIGS